MSNDPQEWTIQSDKEGFFILNEYGEEAENFPARRYTSFESAKKALDVIIRDFIDNYDGPPDGDEWSGGFAENH
jgi:hypothetical protein